MHKWSYSKGDASYFNGAPEWARLVIKYRGEWLYADGLHDGFLAANTNTPEHTISMHLCAGDDPDVVAVREVYAQTGKYNRSCKGVTIDVYDVLQAFEVTNPALQYLVKKALCAGLRGHKDRQEDLNEILESAKRAIELEAK